MSGGATPARLFALLGDPVHHSLSPLLHNTAFRTLEIDAVYVALRTSPDLIGPLMRALASRGGGGNVTVPYKGSAALALDRLSETVKATGACNAFWWEEGRGLCGDNTDVAGFRAAAEHLLGDRLRGCRVLLLGAGGAARAVVQACLEAGATRVDLLNRTRHRAESLCAELASPRNVRVIGNVDGGEAGDYDLIVNATSLGLHSTDPLPIDPEVIRGTALLDLVYGTDETRLVRIARAAGFKSEDGKRMLVEQAVLSFERWLRRSAPRDAMLAAVGLEG